TSALSSERSSNLSTTSARRRPAGRRRGRVRRRDPPRQVKAARRRESARSMTLAGREPAAEVQQIDPLPYCRKAGESSALFNNFLRASGLILNSLLGPASDGPLLVRGKSRCWQAVDSEC